MLWWDEEYHISFIFKIHLHSKTMRRRKCWLLLLIWIGICYFSLASGCLATAANSWYFTNLKTVLEEQSKTINLCKFSPPPFLQWNIFHHSRHWYCYAMRKRNILICLPIAPPNNKTKFAALNVPSPLRRRKWYDAFWLFANRPIFKAKIACLAFAILCSIYFWCLPFQSRHLCSKNCRIIENDAKLFFRLSHEFPH